MKNSGWFLRAISLHFIYLEISLILFELIYSVFDVIMFKENFAVIVVLTFTGKRREK